MPTVTLTPRVHPLNLDVSFGHIIGPMNKPLWPERLMASTALTGRTMIELGLPGIARDVLECLLQ